VSGTGVLESAAGALRDADLHRLHGRVTNLIGLVIEASGLEAEVGELCTIEAGRVRDRVPAEVVGFRNGRTLLMPLGEMHGIGPGNRVTATGQPLRIPVGRELLGRIVDGLGRPLDGGPAPEAAARRSAAGSPRSSRAGAASGSGSSPARASASRRCSG